MEALQLHLVDLLPFNPPQFIPVKNQQFPHRDLTKQIKSRLRSKFYCTGVYFIEFSTILIFHTAVKLARSVMATQRLPSLTFDTRKCTKL